ncbi:MAG: tRNA pseudouridine(38-40) synthase TruA [Candidatus Dependentiae bacterium]|jgi:tRNA pseudouridine38-40 synthase
MNTYKLTIAYDGTAYQGWQVQPTAPTVAGTLATVFKRVFNHDVVILGASRTDTGVHALGQVVRVRTALNIEPQRLQEGWNNALPNDIVIRQTERIDQFHPHVGVVQKTYWYHVFTKLPLPHLARYGWWAPEITARVDWQQFDEALQQFVGTHDFSSFARLEDERKDPQRTVDRIVVTPLPEYDALRVQISGKTFLQYQIRRMIGAALRVIPGSGVTSALIADMLSTPRMVPGASLKAGSQGLCLYSITYEEE